MPNQITLCLTIGNRPEPLEKTLRSLLPQIKFDHIIAINDFRDSPTNEMFRQLCPNGTLINLPEQVGHHKAVDAMYKLVKTKYVFHCEDDWLFEGDIPIQSILNLLNAKSELSEICLRRVEDIPMSEEEKSKILTCEGLDLQYKRLDPLHEQWHGYTFNPHIASLDNWRMLGGFHQFKKERHVSRHFRGRGMHVAYLTPGYCSHIGDGISVSIKPTRLDRMKNWFSNL
ncbi:MAG: glycosyltransferase [Rhodoferax sp.]